MSDITGPPVPKPLPSGILGADRAAKVSRDPHQTSRQATDDSGENKSKSEQRESVHTREPAVSISASAAHLRINEELQERVREIDTEGRPIIVTETATFALRPDAGLRPGDDVVLQVKEAGKTVTADLLRHNNRLIDPPTRLSLVVIAVHNVQAPGTEQEANAAKSLDVAYRPALTTSTAPVVTRASEATTDAEALAKVFSRSNKSVSVKSGVEASEIKQDPLIKSNSSDMATLLAAQQEPKQTVGPRAETVNPAQSVPSTAASILSGTAVRTHLIQPSQLTEPAIANTAVVSSSPASSATGLGPPIAAITLEGSPFQIQLLDTSISSVSPSQVAEVTSVQPLGINVARALPVAAQTLGNTALARVETTQGTFIVPETSANQLVGENVRVAPLAAQASASQHAVDDNTQQTFKARLTSSGTQSGRQVQVQFVPPAQTTPANASANHGNIVTTIDAVHTIRAFLGGGGPTNDLRLDTSVGTLTLTLTNSARPAVGDGIIILPNTTSGAANQPVIPIGAEGAAASTAAGPAAAWPSLEQAYALVQSGLPGAAQSMDSRSAQGGPKLLNSMMFLMAAIKGGSPSTWLGKTAEQAIGGRNANLLQSLKEDLARLFSAGSETTISEWRSLILPFDTKAPDMPMLAALFSQPHHIDPDREQNPDDHQNENKQGQRFVIEVQFSVLGAIQLDGVVRSDRFDLTLWSKSTLPQTLTEDVGVIFSTALAANGFTGSMQFKQSDIFPTDVATILKQQLAA